MISDIVFLKFSLTRFLNIDRHQAKYRDLDVGSHVTLYQERFSAKPIHNTNCHTCPIIFSLAVYRNNENV